MLTRQMFRLMMILSQLKIPCLRDFTISIFLRCNSTVGDKVLFFITFDTITREVMNKDGTNKDGMRQI